MDFKVFKGAIASQFERMSKYPLFRVGVEKDTLWDTYLRSFPAGANNIYKTRTEYDCSCCKQFIRAVGDVVAIIDGAVVSIWDAQINEGAYQTVADALAELVHDKAIADSFLHFEKTAGTDSTRVMEALGAQVQTWQHFYINLPAKYVKKNADIASALGVIRSQHDVFARGLATITDDAIETVLDLIAQNTLYRGEEHKPVVVAFKALKKKYDKVRADDRDIFTWSQMDSVSGAVASIRNTVIGTLLVDLSEGVELERAVASFESKVAPTNYKRPTALVTKAMIEKAKGAITELGLTSALERRYATIEDITVNNILYANRNAKRSMNADVFDDLASKAPVKAKSLDKLEDVPIEKFIIDILPRINSMEVMFENKHTGNLASLIAPVDATAKRLFKWDNHFSWSYNGELADSIKERVKKAGGNVTGDLCCRLAWHNFDDLDFHLIEPNGHEIFFRNKRSPHGGALDVDMNAGSGTTREPVENIFYGTRTKMQEGAYHLFVHQWAKRETANVGFEAEMDWLGSVYRFAYEKPLRQEDRITVAKFSYSKKDGIKIIESLPSTQAARQVWNVSTQTFQPVNVLMLSPNHWDGQTGIGNKHWFFMLEGCRNEGQARGFFNEFLTDELTAHRKVIEMVGAKMRTEESDRQLSGLGFSSTQRNNVLCKVKGSFSRVINLTF